MRSYANNLLNLGLGERGDLGKLQIPITTKGGPAPTDALPPSYVILVDPAGDGDSMTIRF
ncbi:MAG: hypothetical protein ACREA9_03510 [Pyrinomonadaceae bacterium]